MKEVIKTTLKGTPYVFGLVAITTLANFYPTVVISVLVAGILVFGCYIAGTIADIQKGKRVR